MTIASYNDKGIYKYKHLSNKEIEKMKFDYINNSLTVLALSQYYNITCSSAKRIIELID
jgi:hypothetical protein